MNTPSISRALGAALTTLALTTLGTAQNFLVNPAANTSVEGTTRISFPWGAGATDMRYQQICALSTNPAATGLLSQIAHRRDNDAVVASGDYVAWAPFLTLSVSTSPLAAAHMSPVFSENIGKDVTQVFSGALKWPAEQKNAPGPTKFVYTIPFSKQFLYVHTNGDLTYDVQRLVTGPNNNTLFFMDAASSAISSKPQSVTTLGPGCSNPAGKNTTLFYNNWIPGSNFARVLLYNAANNSPVYWSIGATQNMPPLDLAFMGAAGCKLYHDNLVLISGQTSNSTNPYSGRWEQRFRIPNMPALNGASALSQFVLLSDQHIGNFAQLSVSAGEMLTLGTHIPGEPAHSEAHASGLAPTDAALVQQGYGMITQFRF